MRISKFGVGLGLMLALGGCGLAALGLLRKPGPPEDYDAIRALIQANELDRAADGLLARTRKDGRDAPAWLMLGAVRVLQGRDADADAAYRQVKGPGLAWSQAQTQLAEVFLRRKQVDEGEKILRQVVDGETEAVDARRRLAGLLVLTERGAEARVVLRQLLRLEPQVKHLITLTSLGAAEGDNRNDRTELDGYLKVRPDDPILRRARGLVLHRAGSMAEARPDLEAAARSIDGDEVGRVALGECLLAVGALDGIDQAIGAAPAVDMRARSRWWLVKSQVEERRGNVAEALATAQRAFEANPDGRNAQYRVGQLLVRVGKADEAAPLLARAETTRARDLSLVLKLDQCVRGGVDAALYEQIAQLCVESDLVDEARKWFEESIRLDPTRSSAQAGLVRMVPGRPIDPPPMTLPPTLSLKVKKPAQRAPNAGSASKGSSVQVGLRDVAEEWGLAHRYDPHARGDLFLGDTMGGGVGLIDFDEDGRLDVYFVDGCPLPVDPSNVPAPNKLYRNQGGGRFEDVTEKAGVAGAGYGMGCSVADFDADGHDDLYVTGLGRSILYRNKGDGTFEDVTARAKVGTERWSTASGWGDLDGDGDLDLVVVTYVDADPKVVPKCLDPTGRPFHCPPGQFTPEVDLLFRNDGDGTFTDVSKDAGFDVPGGLGLGLSVADLDDDGKLDLFVANDAAPDYLFRNLGNLHFEQVGVSSGVAYDGSGRATASMGVVSEDLDGDARVDLLHVNFLNEASTLLRNLGGGLFDDVTSASGLDANGRTTTGFGVVPFDLENDGRLDLMIANGHVDDRPWADHPMPQRPNLFRSVAPGRFALAPPSAAPYLATTQVGRGLAAGDLDNDGRADLVVVHRDAPAAVLHNESADANRWITLRLVGGDRSGRTPIGARVTCRSGGRASTRWLTSGTSYLSSSDLRMTFGLGPQEKVDAIEVRWPSGTTQSWKDLDAGRFYEVVEGRDPVADPRVGPTR